MLLWVSARFKCYNFWSRTLERTNKHIKDSQIVSVGVMGGGGGVVVEVGNTPGSHVDGLDVSIKLTAS